MFQYASEQFLEIYQVFKDMNLKEISEKTYDSDVREYLMFIKADFLQSDNKKVEKYLDYLKRRVEERKIQNITVSKKFKELHSISQFILIHYPDKIPKSFRDYFEPYLHNLKKQDLKVKSIPLIHLDKLLDASKSDGQTYCIITLLYRAGFKSKEIIHLKTDDLELYDNGLFARLYGRDRVCLIPEDAAEILLTYIGKRQSGYVFTNRQGKPLNAMYISRMMKRYTDLAGIPNYSAENIRNTCAVAMYSYHISDEQVAAQIGTGTTRIRRYKKYSYNEELQTTANKLVNIKVVPPAW